MQYFRITIKLSKIFLFFVFANQSSENCENISGEINLEKIFCRLSEKGPTLKGKHLLHLGLVSFLLG